LASDDSIERKKAAGTRIAAIGTEPPTSHFTGIGEVSLIHVAEHHERQNEPNTGVRVPRTP
jgi:hypothetical protein